jgi:hypothetical protein
MLASNNSPSEVRFMSARWFFEIDGRVGGPITTVQLQLMANSGMLQPQHKIRKENSDQWSVAGEVRGLFGAPNPPAGRVPQAVPMGRPVTPNVPMAVPVPPAAPPPANDDNPFDTWSVAPPLPSQATGNAFDFFSEPAATTAPPPLPPAPTKPAKLSKSKVTTKPAAEAAGFDNAPMASADDNPFAFGEEGAAPPANVPATIPPAQPPAMVPSATGGGFAMPTASDNPFEFEGAAPPAVPTPTMLPAATVPMLRPPEMKPPPTMPKPERKATETRAPTMNTPAGGTPSVVVEVSGQAVEILPGDEVHLLEGTTMFRLHRAWVHVSTKLADETTRTIYLPLHRIDAAMLDQRFEAGRKKSAHSVLVFQSGMLAVGLAYQGSEKPFRNFLEKVLLLSGGKSSDKKG